MRNIKEIESIAKEVQELIHLHENRNMCVSHTKKRKGVETTVYLGTVSEIATDLNLSVHDYFDTIRGKRSINVVGERDKEYSCIAAKIGMLCYDIFSLGDFFDKEELLERDRKRTEPSPWDGSTYVLSFMNWLIQDDLNEEMKNILNDIGYIY